MDSGGEETASTRGASQIEGPLRGLRCHDGRDLRPTISGPVQDALLHDLLRKQASSASSDQNPVIAVYDGLGVISGLRCFRNPVLRAVRRADVRQELDGERPR